MILGATIGIVVAALIGYISFRLGMRRAFFAATVKSIYANAAPGIEQITGYVQLDCRVCTKTNRVPLNRALKRPVCGRCKKRLMPTGPVTICTKSAGLRLGIVWHDYDKMWTTIFYEFTTMGGAARRSTTSGDGVN